MASARVVLVTHPPRGAQAFARGLVGARLAACVSSVRLASQYRWRGKIESARETLLVIKTTAARLRALERHVRAEHPYECPEFVVLAPSAVAASYLRWLAAETR
ncbi:MAG: divalent-cation tolerance protein CutA [Planctomycetes bacterium]|nr:divalent-cation tolerance protein CutA [Planctomycetota bacterium]